MKFFILYGIALIIGSLALAEARADEFGQRFGNEPPLALSDTLDPSTVIYIQPAAGGEETAESLAKTERKAEKVKEDVPKGRVYPSRGPSIEVRSTADR